MDKKELLELRKGIKKKKPTFLRRNHNTKKRLSKNWRKPKGLHNKMRLNKKGYAKTLRHGYGSPALVKDLDYKTGLMPVIVHNKNELLALTKDQGALISSTVSAKKKLELIKVAQEKNIKILQNVERIKTNIDKKKEQKKKSQKEVQERKKAREKKIKKKQEKKKQEEKDKAKESESDKEKIHDNVETQKAKESDKMNKEILQKRV